VVKIAETVPPAGKRAVILAGTGPVGRRAAVLLAQEGAQVTITSRSLERAQAVAQEIRDGFEVEVTPLEVGDDEATASALEGAHILLTSGTEGIVLAKKEIWAPNPTLQVVADVNAVPPLGVEGIKATDAGKEREGKTVFGALGIGVLKMKVHLACVARLFTANDLVLDVEEIYKVAKET
jgi:shikimate 5-dehydrogenase